MTVDENITLLSQNWFLTQPVLYGVFCMQERVANPRIPCAVRVGMGRLEYNPLVLAHKNYRDTEVLFRTEIIRLLMGHPYERRPEGASDEVIGLGSDITLGDNYCFVHSRDKLPVQTPEAYHLPLGMPYEWYVNQLQQKDNDASDPSDSPFKGDGGSDSRESYSALSQLWREDELKQEQLNTFLDHISDWGQLPAELIEQIRISRRARPRALDIFNGFRAQIIGSTRVLTRTRPNRRTGYLQMGSRRDYTTRLLVAVDVSCSVRPEDLERFYATINHIFRHQVATIDICTFDTVVSTPVPMTRTYTDLSISGRGGTDLQTVLDFVQPSLAHSALARTGKGCPQGGKGALYDALIVLTDGEAPAPRWSHSAHPHLLWVLSDYSSYERHRPALSASGRVTYIV